MKKINLEDLKVQSFVTSISEDSLNTIKGGGGETQEHEWCNSTPPDPRICHCNDLSAYDTAGECGGGATAPSPECGG